MMISACDITKRYGDRTVLDGVSLDVAPGESVAIVGSAGSGRSTFLRLLATLEPPTSGTLAIGGLDAAAHLPAVRQRIAMAESGCAGADGLRVDEYVRLIAESRHVPPERTERMEALLRQAGVPLTARVDGLQIRTRALLATAAALLVEADVVLLDDPFHDLDGGVRRRLAADVDAARRRGAALVLTAGDESALRGVCGRGIRIEAGRAVTAWSAPGVVTLRGPDR
jgi:ABC-type multidrug transport system ATPase subunit